MKNERRLRPENGYMAFKGDQSGVFIRGDECWELVNMINKLLNTLEKQMDDYQYDKVYELSRLLGQSHSVTEEFYGNDNLKDFAECVLP